ncbi:unnamed protein product [Prunus armeniaca]
MSWNRNYDNMSNFGQNGQSTYPQTRPGFNQHIEQTPFITRGSLSDGKPPLLPTPIAGFEVMCQLCNKQGHVARVCPERGNYVYTAEATNANPNENTSWCLDSGATHHMPANLFALPYAQPYTGTDTIIIGNGNHLAITHIGNTNLSTTHKALELNEVLCVHAIRKNLISIRRFCRDNDCFFEMNANGFRVKDNKTGKVLLTGSSYGGLYHINAVPNVTNKIVFYAERTTQDVWHARLGHPSHSVFRTLLNKHHLPINGIVASTKVRSTYLMPYVSSSTESDVFRPFLALPGPSQLSAPLKPNMVPPIAEPISEAESPATEPNLVPHLEDEPSFTPHPYGPNSTSITPNSCPHGATHNHPIRAFPPVQPSPRLGGKKKILFQRSSPGPGRVWNPPPRAGPKATSA